MKTTVTFELDDLEERGDMHLLLNRAGLYLALNDFSDFLRYTIKHEVYQDTQEAVKCLDTAERMQKEFHEILENRGIDLDLFN